MQADHASMMSMTRRAYETGRLRTSIRKALYVVVPVAIVACFTTGPAALAWLPVTFVAWVIAHWRGGPLLRGAFFGLVGGIPSVCFGPYAEAAHGVGERVYLPSVVQTAQVMGLFIRDWCGLS